MCIHLQLPLLAGHNTYIIHKKRLGAFRLLQDLFREIKFYRARVITIREYLKNNYLNKIRGLIFIEMHNAYK